MIIVFTDLDGTLLDAETYSYQPAADALQEIAALQIPLIIMSSKTRSEIEFVRRDLKNNHPFVSENGGGIFIPEGYFPFSVPHTRRTSGYFFVEIGVPYLRLTAFLEQISREYSLPIRGFHSLSVGEVSHLTGLSTPAASRAKEREYDEPFLFDGDRVQWGRLEELVTAEGFVLTRGGRFHHVSGPHDKGTAAGVLIDCYRRRYPNALFVGVGDAANDLPFLRLVDRPVLVQRPDGTYESEIDIPGLYRASRPGPAGWGETVLELIHRGRSG
ncbi:MAG: HAD-IIB family hydrolase [Syntrophales bacterium]|nr:HAD-IIB family hydrolase [Syntrophales bacterium]